MFDCNCSLVENFKYYIPENTGLFTGNPIIVVDDFQEDEVKTKALAKIRKDYHTSMNNAGAKFLLGFVPGWAGEALGYGWEIFSEWQETGTIAQKKLDAKKMCEYGLKLLLEEGMKKRDIEKELESKNEAIREANDREEERRKDAINKGLDVVFEPKKEQIDIQKALNDPREMARKERELVKNEVSQSVSSAKAQIEKGLQFTAEIAKITKTYIESSSLVSSPFFDGAGFGDKPKSDSLYLLAVGIKSFITDPKTLVTSLTTSGGSFAFFKNREIIRDGRSPFNYQLGDTGGLLARKKDDPADSIKSFRAGFQEKIAVLKEDFNKNTVATLPDYIKKIASDKPGEKFSDVLKKTGGNPSLISYFEGNGLAQKFNKALTDPETLKDPDKAELTAFLNLVMYIDTAYIICPACENIVSLSWGWCPYHATREQLKLTDNNGNGKLKDEFLLMDETKQSIQKILNSPLKKISNDDDDKKSNKRLLVHWTEFIIG